jgi:hypothetical protein
MFAAQALHRLDGAGVEARSLRSRFHRRPPNENSLSEGRQHDAAEDGKRIDQARAGYGALTAISGVHPVAHLHDLEHPAIN